MISVISVTSVSLLIIVSIRLAAIYHRTQNYFHLFLGISALFGAIAFLAWMNPQWINATGYHIQLYQWSMAAGLSALVSSAAWLVYVLKPDFARFPVWFCFLPLVLLLLIPILQDSGLLLQIVFLIYQVAAIAIFMMLYFMRTDESNGNILIFLGLVLVALSVMLFWTQEIFSVPHYIVPVPFIPGVIVAHIGFEIKFRDSGNAMDYNSINEEA